MTWKEAEEAAISALLPMGERWGADLEKIRAGNDYRVKLAAEVLMRFCDGRCLKQVVVAGQCHAG